MSISFSEEQGRTRRKRHGVSGYHHSSHIWVTAVHSSLSCPLEAHFAHSGSPLQFSLVWRKCRHRKQPRRGTGRCRRRGRLGSWAPAFGGAGLGRLGEWRPPGPSRFRFRFCFCFCSFFLRCRTVWLSVARQCGAAGLRLVTWFYLFAQLPCCTLLFFRFSDAVLLPERCPIRAPVCRAGFYQAWASRPVSPG